MKKKNNDTRTVEEDNIAQLPKDFLKNARPAAEVLGELFGKKKAAAFLEENRAEVAKRGRPRKENKKREIKLRIDPDVLDAFKASGKGWQTQINNVLREHMPL
jgi:uncharacterized protein (DUF4415 family)